jgi:MarR family transcriptional regulator, temperature-dependent positive regulator of motility
MERDAPRGTLPVVADGLAISAMPGHLIRRLHQASVAIFDNEMRRAGVDLTPVQYAALTMVETQPGLDQATLAQGIGYDRVTIGGVVDRLEAKGLVRRDIDDKDRRARRLCLSSAGRALLAAVAPRVVDVQAQTLQGLSADEADTLCRLMRRALDAVGDVSRIPQTARRGKP